MSKPVDNSQFAESWRKELEGKSLEELVEIIAHQEHYNAEFVKMAQSKLTNHKDYSKETVSAMIEERQKLPQPKVKDPANTMLNIFRIGCSIVIGAIVLLLVIAIISAGGMESGAAYHGIIGAMAMAMFGVVLFLFKFGKKLWRKKS